MTTFVVLVRGVNVGGRNRLPMAEFRAALESEGLTSVRTYIQSGNVVLDHPGRDAGAVADRVRAVIAQDFGLDVPAVALTARDLDRVIAGNPFPAAADRLLHAVVLPSPARPAVQSAVATLQSTAAGRGSRDAVVLAGRVAYLHTPDGFGTSDLAKALSARTGPLASGTARNWATVTALQGMCAE